MYATYSYDYSDYLTAADSGIWGALLGFLFAMWFVLVAVGILQIVAMWKVFTKAGEAGWKALIPIYNAVILYRISGINPLLLLVCLGVWIPVIGQLAALGISIYQAVSLSKAFGKEGGFAVGLILLGPIFYMILGFGSSTYVGPKFGEGTTTPPPAAE